MLQKIRPFDNENIFLFKYFDSSNTVMRSFAYNETIFRYLLISLVFTYILSDVPIRYSLSFDNVEVCPL